MTLTEDQHGLLSQMEGALRDASEQVEAAAEDATALEGYADYSVPSALLQALTEAESALSKACGLVEGLLR